jgi:hypothetical protein
MTATEDGRAVTWKWLNQLEGCGIEHPDDWQPKVVIRVNLIEVGGDDIADAFAHYLLQCGYPRDRPEHLRKMGESMAQRRGVK